MRGLLTERQAKVLAFIEEATEGGRVVTMRQVAEHFSITAKGAWDHVAALRKKGYVATNECGRSGIRLAPAEVAKRPRVKAVPLYKGAVT